MFRVAPGDQAPGSFARTGPLRSSPAYCKAFDAYLYYGEPIRLEAGLEWQGEAVAGKRPKTHHNWHTQGDGKVQSAV